jgi:hypothetical protein
MAKATSNLPRLAATPASVTDVPHSVPRLHHSERFARTWPTVIFVALISRAHAVGSRGEDDRVRRLLEASGKLFAQSAKLLITLRNAQVRRISWVPWG